MAVALSSRGALAVLLLACGAVPAAAQRQLEYEVKGQFLGHFIDFVEWPATVFAAPDAPFRLCLLGADPFGAPLRAQLSGEQVAGHRLVIERAKDEASAAACHMVFVRDASPARAEALRKATRGRPVLVVGDSVRLLEHCVAIAFVVEGGYVRFDVNLPALAAQGLRVNPRLLRVARDATDRYARCR
jgi:hypothetical protein